MELHRLWLWVLGFTLLGVWMASGCGSSATQSEKLPASSPSGPAFPAVQKSAEPVGSPPPGTISSEVVDFKDDRGQLICPVMGTVIASPREAVASEVYNGKRYYFCCSECPPKFRSDPARFADGKALGPSAAGDTGAGDGAHEEHEP